MHRFYRVLNKLGIGPRMGKDLEGCDMKVLFLHSVEGTEENHKI